MNIILLFASLLNADASVNKFTFKQIFCFKNHSEFMMKNITMALLIAYLVNVIDKNAWKNDKTQEGEKKRYFLKMGTVIAYLIAAVVTGVSSLVLNSSINRLPNTISLLMHLAASVFPAFMFNKAVTEDNLERKVNDAEQSLKTEIDNKIDTKVKDQIDAEINEDEGRLKEFANMKNMIETTQGAVIRMTLPKGAEENQTVMKFFAKKDPTNADQYGSDKSAEQRTAAINALLLSQFTGVAKQ